MSPQVFPRALGEVSAVMLSILCLLAASTVLLAGQVTISAGPLRMSGVRTIYIAPSSDDFGSLVSSRLENWSAVELVSKPEEADATLDLRSESTIIPAKVAVWRIVAQATLVDRRTQKVIWKTTKSASFDRGRLADDVVEQFKKDWRQSVSEY